MAQRHRSTPVTEGCRLTAFHATPLAVALLLLGALSLTACMEEEGAAPIAPVPGGPAVVPGRVTAELSGTLVTNEVGWEDTFSVVLTQPPEAAVTVVFSGGDSTEGIVTPPAVTFTPATWSQPQIVTVTGLDDEETDGNQSYGLILNPATSADINYAASGAFSIQVINGDNERPGVIVNPIRTTFSEAGGTGLFSIFLNTAPDGDVVFAVTCTDPSEALLSDGVAPPAEQLSVVFSPADWSAPRTVTLHGVDDAENDGDQYFNLQLRIVQAATTDGTGYQSLGPTPVAITVTDDEATAAAVHLARACN